MASMKQSVNETAEQLQCEIIDQADEVPEVVAWNQLPEKPGKAYNASASICTPGHIAH